jgi:hypothetical protein
MQHLPSSSSATLHAESRQTGKELVLYLQKKSPSPPSAERCALVFRIYIAYSAKNGKGD